MVTQIIAAAEIEDGPGADLLKIRDRPLPGLAAGRRGIAKAQIDIPVYPLKAEGAVQLVRRDVRQAVALLHVAPETVRKAGAEFGLGIGVIEAYRHRQPRPETDQIAGRQLKAFDAGPAAVELIADLAGRAADRVRADTDEIRIARIKTDGLEPQAILDITQAGLQVDAFFLVRPGLAGTGR